MICVWFTGLSGAGKTTLAVALKEKLLSKGYTVYHEDGDISRQKKNFLGFSHADRIKHNIMVIDEVAQFEKYDFVLVSLISPFQKTRDYSRKKINNYFEIFVSCPIEVCIERDPKKIYEAYFQGKIKDVTGLDQEYEIPNEPNLITYSNQNSIKNCVENIYGALVNKFSLAER